MGVIFNKYIKKKMKGKNEDSPLKARALWLKLWSENYKVFIVCVCGYACLCVLVAFAKVSGDAVVVTEKSYLP